ncbi:MAG: orotidine-5'-phosphate decarboxylase [Eubacteriales bacterium]|jgi:orotidine-5'-phosphate decarboxylase
MEKRIICALDFDEPARAMELVRSLDGVVDFFKVGMELQLAGGTKMLQWLLDSGKRVFLDMKYFDVPETVQKVVTLAARLGVDFLTIHGNGGIIEAAAAGRGNSNLKLLAVTVLTCLDAADILDFGYSCSVEELVLARVKKSIQGGCDGVIASGSEAALLRRELGRDILIVTPGIRSAGSAVDSHKRSVTPREAIDAGADYLVIGRPITKVADPRSAAQKILEEIS